MPPIQGRGRGRGRGRPITRPQRGIGRQSPPRPESTEAPMNREEMANLVAQQIAAAIPDIVAQVNVGRGEGPGGGTDTTRPINRRQPEGSIGTTLGCTYKAFMGCKPKEFHGTEGTINALRWIDEMEAILDISKCAEEDKVRFVTHSLKDEALEWWNSIIQGRGRSEANNMSWSEFVKLMTEKYCPINEMEKLQTEFLSLSMVGCKVMEYTQRFNALARLLPSLVTPESQKVNRYIWGLDSRVRGFVKASQPATMKSAMELAAIVTDDRVRSGEFDEDRSDVTRKSYNQGNGKRKPGRDEKYIEYDLGESERKKGRGDQKEKNMSMKAKIHQGTNLWCDDCNRSHPGKCKPKVCYKCKQPGHIMKDCRTTFEWKCFECGSVGHLRNMCPKLGRNNKDPSRNQG